MPDHQETRPSLVLRLQNARDEAAWTEFLALYQSLILRMLTRFGLQETDARDVCQQVLAAVAKDVGHWKSDERQASFRRWLFRIARNRALKFLQRESARCVAEGGSDAHRRLESCADANASLTEEFDREYRQQLLLLAGEQIRDEFRETTWRAFWLTSIENREVAAVAAELHMSTGSVYVARSRIIARLREKVRELEGED